MSLNGKEANAFQAQEQASGVGGILVYSGNMKEGCGPGEPRARGDTVRVEAGKESRSLTMQGLAGNCCGLNVCVPQIHMSKH